MRTRLLVKQGDFCPSFSLEDRIFLGEGLFETIRVEQSMPCFPDLHWARLSASATQLGIPFDLSFDAWANLLASEIKKENLYQGGIKAILSGGIAPRGLSERGQVSQLVFQTFNYSAPKGLLRLISIPWLRDEANPIYQVKSVNYLESILARRRALAHGADDALFYNTRLCVTETTCANLFIIKQNHLITPPVTDGVLPGITRERLFKASADLGMVCQEQSLTKAMIESADAVLTTNSLQGVCCVIALDDVHLPVSHPMLNQLVAFASRRE